MFCIGRERACFALRVGRHDLAVIAAADNPHPITGRCKNGPAVDVNTPRLGFGRGKEKRFLAKNEHRCASEKMCANNRSAGRHRVCSLDDRDGVTASVCHLIGAACAFPPHKGEGGNHAMQFSNPSRIFSSGRLRPMKTMRLSRFSSFFHGR